MIQGKRTSGFSLIEVLISLAIMSTIILAVTGLVTAGLHRAYGAKKMTEAATLAQAVMERVNQAQAQSLSDDTSTTSRTESWSKTGALAVTPAAEGTAEGAERDEWRKLLLNAPLPASIGTPATLTTRFEAVPAGSTFATATMIRISVDVTWSERGVRARQVRLQTTNLP